MLCKGDGRVVMEIFGRFLDEYAVKLLYTVITAIAGVAGVVLKQLVSKRHHRKLKRRVVKDCLQAALCVYKDLPKEEQYKRTIRSVSEILVEKGVYISEIETMLLMSQEYELFDKLHFGDIRLDSSNDRNSNSSNSCSNSCQNSCSGDTKLPVA